MKNCSVCGQAKSLDEFGRNARARDGLRAQCKRCNAARVRGLRLSPIVGREVVVDCAHCGTVFRYTSTGHVRMYCSGDCRYRAGEARKLAASTVRPRRCACGVLVATRVGKPVCPGCRVDKRDQVKAFARERVRTLRRYGLTPEGWDRLVLEQGDRCAICRTEKPGGRGELWHIDHDHVTNTVRGLLCHNCNVGLGNFRDDPALLRAAAEYLEVFPPGVKPEDVGKDAISR